MTSTKVLKRKLKRKTRKMTNEELRTALWIVRDKMDTNTEPMDLSSKLFIQEEVYSQELKRRELLEWALKTKE